MSSGSKQVFNLIQGKSSNFQPRTFQPFQQKKQAYPNRALDDSLVKDFFGKLLSGSYADISDFFSKYYLPIGNIRDESGDGPLHIILKMNDNRVSRLEKLQICKLLINKGASVNLMNRQDITPIHLAAQLQYDDIIELLVNSGANINSLNSLQQNALHLAIRPNINQCPSMNVQPIIPKPEMKFRDINNISKAVWQHFNTIVKIKENDKNNTYIWPTNAIKNIIDGSTKYLRRNDKKYFSNKLAKFMKDVKKIYAGNNTLSEQDKNAQIQTLISDTEKEFKNDMMDYYKFITDDMMFAEDKAFTDQPDDDNNDNLKYFSTNSTEDVIFATKNINYKEHFINAINTLDKKYNECITKINKILHDTASNVSHVEMNVRKLHFLNHVLYHSIDYNKRQSEMYHIGEHHYLNDTNEEAYKKKYNLPYLSKDISHPDEEEYFNGYFNEYIRMYITMFNSKLAVNIEAPGTTASVITASYNIDQNPPNSHLGPALTIAGKQTINVGINENKISITNDTDGPLQYIDASNKPYNPSNTDFKFARYNIVGNNLDFVFESDFTIDVQPPATGGMMVSIDEIQTAGGKAPGAKPGAKPGGKAPAAKPAAKPPAKPAGNAAANAAANAATNAPGAKPGAKAPAPPAKPAGNAAANAAANAATNAPGAKPGAKAPGAKPPGKAPAPPAKPAGKAPAPAGKAPAPAGKAAAANAPAPAVPLPYKCTVTVTIATKTDKYFNTSLLNAFFETWAADYFRQTITVIKFQFDSINKDAGSKYNYYRMYNLLTILNYTYNEYCSTLDIIRKTQANEGLRQSTYNDVDLKNADEIKKMIDNINNMHANDSMKLNKEINKLVKILNLHQTMTIQYALVKRLYSSVADPYKLNAKALFDTVQDELKFKSAGIFNKSMPPIPYIDVDKYGNDFILDDKFYENAYPDVDNLKYLINVPQGQSLNTYPYVNVIKINGPDSTLPIEAVSGKLLFNYSDSHNTYGNLYFNKVDEMVRKIVDKSIYRDGDEYKGGIIGLYAADQADPILDIDLLRESNIPYDLTNTYMDADTISKSDTESKYIEMLMMLRRLYITTIMKTRKILITKDAERSDVIINNESLYMYINKVLAGQFKYLNKTDIVALTNRIIAESIDKIIMKNISAYIEEQATRLMKYMITSSDTKSDVDPEAVKDIPILEQVALLMPMMPDSNFQIKLTDVNDLLYDVIMDSVQYKNMRPIDLIDIDMVNMATEETEFKLSEYEYKQEQKDFITEKRTLYYKPDYMKMDLSIIKPELMQCYINNMDVITKLITLRINVNHPDYWEKTPMMYAIESRNASFVQNLLAAHSNLLYKNFQDKNTLEYLTSLEIAHQEQFINADTELILCETYKLMLNNVFDSNVDLKKNIPTNINIVNYLPIYIFNWQLALPNLKNNSKQIAAIYKKIIDNKSNAAFKFENDSKLLFGEKSGDDRAKYKEVIDKYNTTMTNNPIVNALDSKIRKIQKILATLNSGDKYHTELTVKLTRYQYQRSKFTSGAPPPTIAFYKYWNDMVPTTSDRPTDLLENITDLPDENINIGMKYTILSDIIQQYIKFDQSKQTENIHIILSCIYSKLLYAANAALAKIKTFQIKVVDFIALEQLLKDIIIVENNIKVIADYLDTRYINSTLVENKILDDLRDNIAVTLRISVANNFIITVKKLLYNHIIQTFGTDKQHFQLISDLFKNSLTASIYNIATEYSKLLLDIKEHDDDHANLEYNTLDKIFDKVRIELVSNNILPLAASSQLVKNLDQHIIPYYKTLFRTVGEHIKKLVLNYMKFILNQYEGIQIARMILEKMLEQGEIINRHRYN
jgi:ankyrin repeat protein